MKDRIKIVADSKIPFLQRRLGDEVELVAVPASDITPAVVADADALLVRTRTQCGRALLEKSAVRLVVTATIGTDHIDLGWCREKGIVVENAAGCNAPGVAQYVWSSLLRCGFDPRKDTLGIVGYGNVGQIVGAWGRLLGCRVRVCDPPRRREGHRDVDYITLDQILNESDAVTLHTPLTYSGDDPTYHLIGRDELLKMKRGSMLINASRGEVVDDMAWNEILVEGRAKGVVDTWEGEPDINMDLLRNAAIATPHIAGYSLEGKQRATRMALEAVERFFGIVADKSGLAGSYVLPDHIATEAICRSYNPFADTEMLRRDPGRFEALRNEYAYRGEP